MKMSPKKIVVSLLLIVALWYVSTGNVVTDGHVRGHDAAIGTLVLTLVIFLFWPEPKRM